MTMNKTRSQIYIIIAILAVVFSAVFFLLPIEYTSVAWIGYGAEMLAIGLQVPVFKLAYDGAELKSKVLGFPIFRVGIIYLAAQTVLSIILIAAGQSEDFPVWLAALLCILVLAAALVCGITTNIARDEITNIENKTVVDTRLMKNLAMRAQGLSNKTDNAELRSALTKLSESFTYSDPVSSPATAAAEFNLNNLFGQLETAVANRDPGAVILCKEVGKALEDRNIICKSNKN